ncbi:class I SAM-dependent methyltransferase [Amorphus sp. MBR-141]
MPVAEDLGLSGVARTLLVPLCARAQAARLFPAAGFRDASAERIVELLGVDASSVVSDPISVLGFISRAKIFDHHIARFLAAHPDGIILDLGAGLSTACERQPATPAGWICVDLPEVAALRRRLIPDTASCRVVSASLDVPGWLDGAALPAAPTLVVAEGLMPYLHAASIGTLLGDLADGLTGRPCELVYDAFSFLMVGTARYHPSIGALARRDPSIEFVSGVKTRADYCWGEPRWMLDEICDVMEQLPPPVALWSSVVEGVFGVPIYAIAHLHLDANPARR